MRNYLALTATFVALAVGCHGFGGQQPVPIQVVDAETQKPVSGAVVHVSAVHGDDTWTAQAGPNGLAEITPKSAETGPFLASASAEGYLNGASEFDAVVRGPTQAGPHLVSLYHGPAPSVVVTVPNGYRGPVVLTVKTDAVQPSARAFSATVADNGDATVIGPAVIGTLLASDISAKYADGTAIPTDGADDVPQFRWMKTTGQIYTFHVGVKVDADLYRKQIDAPPAKSDGWRGTSDGQGKKGGGGHRGGGGGGGRGGMGGGSGQ